MDFSLTEEQTLLRDTVRALLARECPASLLRAHFDDRAAAGPLWQHLSGYAGVGDGPTTDTALVLEETGFVAAPGPFFASVALAAPLLRAAGRPEADPVAAGDQVATVALAGPDGRWVPRDGLTRSFVLDADLADLVVVVARGPRLGVVEASALPPPSEVATVDPSRRVFALSVEGVSPETAVAPERYAAWFDRALTLHAAETVGVTRRILAMTLEHAKVRVQFDRPIGSFQAIQHKLAEMSLEHERATAATHYAAMTVDAAHPDRPRAARVAAAAARAAARRVLRDGIQIHGGIGYTWEHDLHLYLRRATAAEHLLGTTPEHHAALADLLFG